MDSVYLLCVHIWLNCARSVVAAAWYWMMISVQVALVSITSAVHRPPAASTAARYCTSLHASVYRLLLHFTCFQCSLCWETTIGKIFVFGKKFFFNRLFIRFTRVWLNIRCYIILHIINFTLCKIVFTFITLNKLTGNYKRMVGNLVR